MLKLNKLYNMDCMEGMKQFPDKYFELAIVDPPYGINVDENMAKNSCTQYGKAAAPKRKYISKGWDKKSPPKEYFDELFRVSKNQIIWGANHFIELINKNSSCWIVWDKHINGAFADCELAWTSFTSPVRKFDYTWNGMIQENMKNKEIRIHPTQKPIALYKWLLKNYAKKGDKILDTHVGSASSLIACHQMNFDYIGFEIDKEYFEKAQKRIADEIAQISLFYGN